MSDPIELARTMLAEQGTTEDEIESMSDDELYEHFWDNVFEVAEPVRTMSWSRGSYAQISRYKGYFVGFDDAERYGPFETYEEAEKDGPQFWGDDEVNEDWTHPEFATKEEGEES